MTGADGSPAGTGAVAVVGTSPGAGWELAAGLAGRGERVVFVPAAPGDGAASEGAVGGTGGTIPGVVLAPSWDLESGDGLVASLAAVPERLRATVWAWVPPTAGDPTMFDELGEDAWEALAEQPIRHCLAFLQGTFAHFAGALAAAIVLVPTTALMGAPAGLVAWATATEGQRALVRVAARNWGSHGLTVHSVAVTPDLLVTQGERSHTGGGAAVDGAVRRLRAGLPRPSIPAPTLGDDVAAVVSSLSGPEWRSVTGETIGVDGGLWMAP